MSKYLKTRKMLSKIPKKWLLTGVAGFIGSNILETLLKLDQEVIGLDNFSTGYQHNLDQVKKLVSEEQWKRFHFTKGDIRDLDTCVQVCHGADYVVHQAALGSVPRSIEDPLLTNTCNVDGFLNMLVAARDAKVKKFVYAASSSTYGDSPELPKVEEKIGKPLSPYAVTKYVNELYADVFATNYGLNSVGLRYFNVFGPRQDPKGAYAAVIPQWFAGVINGAGITINGDGETSRDFCYIDNVVQANILAACTEKSEAINQVYNVAVGEKITLNELFMLIRQQVSKQMIHREKIKPNYAGFRQGDVRHSLADISKAQNLLGYLPLYKVSDGLSKAGDWYLENLPRN